MFFIMTKNFPGAASGGKNLHQGQKSVEFIYHTRALLPQKGAASLKVFNSFVNSSRIILLDPPPTLFIMTENFTVAASGEKKSAPRPKI